MKVPDFNNSQFLSEIIGFFVLLVLNIFFWIVLSGEINTIMITFGFFSSLLAVFCAFFFKISMYRFDIISRTSFYSYLKVLILSIISSSFNLSKIIWSNFISIRSRVYHLENDSKNDVAVVLSSNAITLTPGTTVLGVDDDEILVHSLEYYKDNSNLENVEIKDIIEKMFKNA
jgi:multicomponent Na+:H+ antiporter subunit E